MIDTSYEISRRRLNKRVLVTAEDILNRLLMGTKNGKIVTLVPERIKHLCRRNRTINPHAGSLLAWFLQDLRHWLAALDRLDDCTRPRGLVIRNRLRTVSVSSVCELDSDARVIERVCASSWTMSTIEHVTLTKGDKSVIVLQSLSDVGSRVNIRLAFQGGKQFYELIKPCLPSQFSELELL